MSGGINDFFGNLFKANKTNDIEKIINDISLNFKDNFYLEIQRHNEENEKKFEELLIKISTKLNLPLIASLFYMDKNMQMHMMHFIVLKKKLLLMTKVEKIQ